MQGKHGIGYLLLVTALAAALTGCLGVTQGRTVDDDLSDYQKTLRDQADWLWDNMNYARVNSHADGEHCRVKNFEYKPIPTADSLRDTDGTAAGMAEQLTYAKQLIDEAQNEWFAFCRGEISAAQTARHMEAQLRPAYTSLNTVQTTLTQRAAVAAKGK